VSDLLSGWASDRIHGARFELRGWIADYLGAVGDRWLKVAPFRNPAMLDMFSDRDREPKRVLNPWSGEFAGKYLTSAVQVYRLTGDPFLRELIAGFVARLVSLQAEDGYLGAWPKENRLTGHAPNSDMRLLAPQWVFDWWDGYHKTWDAQSHYHTMLGLLLWFEETGDAAALVCARRIGDLLCDVFESTPLVDMEAEPVHMNTTEMNQAPIHSLCILYRHTGEERYLNLAKKIRDEFAAVNEDGQPVAGDYVNAALAGREFFEMHKPRWESLYPLMGLAELAAITGDADSRRAFELLWWSIVMTDRHNNGGFSSYEEAVGNPYDPRGIETCCTIAWLATSVEMLRLTADSIVADELEFTTLNSGVGLHSSSGAWVTYNTPMDGIRVASTTTLTAQAREGSPDLNCCSAHGARALGTISDWAVMATSDGVTLNWYGPGTITVPLGDARLTLEQETEYPRDDEVRLRVGLDESRSFLLRLRIPYWSTDTRVVVNGEDVPGVESGQYLALERTWRHGDEIHIVFDFSLQYWVGEREAEDKVSIYRGPILLTYDRRLNEVDPDDLPALDARGLDGRRVESDNWIPPMLLMEFTGVDGRTLRLCDFASAGVGGSPYRSWLDVRSCAATEFTRRNPRRSGVAADPRGEAGIGR
jgi:DUF1680 family protein